jgi:hypothetical protein
MNRRPDPLDANERALAELLARDALLGPSPQLDARILAAARAASKPAPAARRPRPRWIAGMSIAATLVLAAGIAWRLRPLPERPAPRTIPVAVRAIEPRNDAAGTNADVVVPQPQPRARELPRQIPAERESTAAPTPPPEPPVVFDEPSPMAKQAPPPAPPPADAPAARAGAVAAMPADTTPTAQKPQQAYSQDEAKTLDRLEVTGNRIPASSPQAFPRATYGTDAAAAANAAAESGVSRAVLDEEPPATADSPQVRDAWLQRIRELLAAGDTDAARNSLAEFRKRYPKYALPEDLRPLAKP